jgi:GT2 family glycosyltransferase
MTSSKIKNEFISIVICSRDRRKDLEALITSLIKMETNFHFEIIVVEETDNPIPISGAIYVPHPIANRGIPYARNLALANAKGKIIVFLDDDCIIHNEWLDNLLEPFNDDSVVGVQGGVTVPIGSNALGWVESILGVPGGGIRRVYEAKGENQETREISTLNCAYRRWVIEKVGGFERELKITGEDYVLAKKVCDHGRCLFIPNAMVSHDARGSFNKIWHWFIRRGRAEIDVIRVGKQKDTTIWTVLRSTLLLKLFLLVVFCIIIPKLFIPLTLLGLFVYFSLQYVRYYEAWKNSDAKICSFMLLPIVKLTMDTAMDWGRFLGLIID